jgi:hypothetical protein
MIAVEFDATRDDMAAFQVFVTGSIRKAVRTPAYYSALAVLIAVVAVFVSGAVDFVLHVSTVLVVLVLFAIFWTIIARMYRRAATPLENGSLAGPRRIIVDEDGIRQIAALHEARTNWRGVLAVHQTSGHLFLMTDRLSGYIVPRRAFTDPAQYTAFVDFVRKRAGQ